MMNHILHVHSQVIRSAQSEVRGRAKISTATKLVTCPFDPVHLAAWTRLKDTSSCIVIIEGGSVMASISVRQ